MSLSNTASAGRWPARLPVGSFRVVRPSANYEQTIQFYRDLVGLPVLETFQGSYGEDGTIFGLPDSTTHLGIVRVREPAGPVNRFDQLVFYLADEPSQQDVMPDWPRMAYSQRSSSTPTGRPTAASPTTTPTGEGWSSPPGSTDPTSSRHSHIAEWQTGQMVIDLPDTTSRR